MSTKAQQHKSKIAQITCAVTAFALAPIQSALGVTAAERFRALQNINNDGGFMKSRWFTIIMLLVLSVSIAALVIVSLYRKLRDGRRQKAKNAGQARETRESTKQITERETQKTTSLPSNIEQRVSNIEKQVSAIEQRLTNLEKEVSSFEVIEDDLNVETQVLAATNPGKEIK